LHISYSLGQKNYTLGQDIELRAVVTDNSSTALDAVFVTIPAITNPQLITAETTQAGPLTLAPEESQEVTFTFGTIDIGTVDWQLVAYSVISADSSILLQTEPVTINSPSPPVSVEMINSIPTAVTLGQTHVFPFSIRYALSEPGLEAAPARLDSLTIVVSDLEGAPQLADACFARLVLSSGYEPLSVIEEIPSASEVIFRLNPPLILTPESDGLLSLRVDISNAATSSGFRLSIAGPEGIQFVDNNSEQPIEIIAQGGFPLSTLSCQIDAPSEAIAVSSEARLSEFVNYGQANVDLLTLNLRHPGDAGDSRVQLTGLRLRVEDDLGFPIAADAVLRSLQLLQEGMVMADVSVFTAGSENILIKPFAPPVIAPGTSGELMIRARVLDAPLGNGFNVIIDDSTGFELRDLSSGSFVAATADTTSIVTQVLFPISSGVATFKCPAEDPLACVIPGSQQSVIAGAPLVELATIDLSYPLSGDCSPSVLTRVNLALFDRDGRALDPSALFDRTGYRLDDGSVNYMPFVELSGGEVVFRTDDPDFVIDPGESHSLTLIADLESNIPYDHFKFSIAADAFSLHDLTDPSHILDVVGSTGCATAFPVISDEIQVLLPAGRPVLSHDSQVRLTHSGEQGVVVFSADLSYSGANPLGDLILEGITGNLMHRGADGLETTAVDNLFENLSFQFNGNQIGATLLLSGSEFSISLNAPQILEFGTISQFSLVANMQANAPAGNYTIQFEDSSFISITDQQLGGEVHPLLSGTQYPLRGIELSIAQQGLEGSFTNFPNPFYPGRSELTTFGFVLPEAATIEMKIFTITGELVTTLIEREHRAAGAYQDDRWNGVNDLNLQVLPGAYFCRLSVTYDSGKSDSVMRKVAVIR
jgi:hypothetical protein